MPAFPMFVDLKDKRCVVVGGGNVASRKIEAMLAFGPGITVISTGVSSEIAELENKGRVKVVLREYKEGDIIGASVVIAASDNEAVNEKVYNDCIQRGIMVNTVDDPDKCTFIFPALVRRKDLVVGISTSGRYPSMSGRLRKDIEALVPGYWGDVLDVVSSFREKAKSQIKSMEKRKIVLAEIMEEALRSYGLCEREQLSCRLEELFEENRDDKDD